VSGERREPLLLLHGLGGSKEIWSPVIGLLEAERAPLAIDLPGFGTEPPLAAQVEPSAANLAAVVHERCLELGIERPHVAGNSLGGWVGLEMGRAGWASSVTAISPAGLWRAPIGERRVNTQLWARRLRPLVAVALRTAACASACSPPSPLTRTASPPRRGARWCWAGSTPAATTAPTG